LLYAGIGTGGAIDATEEAARDAVEFAVMGVLSIHALAVGVFRYARELIHGLFG